MKTFFSATTLLSAILITSLCFAVPTLTVPAFKNIGSNMVTLTLHSSEAGTGYFTLLPGTSANCASGTRVAFGPYSSGSSHGSRPLFANVSGNYTVRNLSGDSPYTTCFTADSPKGENLNDSPVSANLTTSAATTLAGLEWLTVGSAGFSNGTASYVSLAFAPDGTPHIAYSDDANGGMATVKKFVGDAWSLVGSNGFSAGSAKYLSLAFSPDGTPHVAYSDEANGAKSTVMKFSDGAWIVVGSAGFSTTTSSSLMLAFAPDGTPHVAFSSDDYNPGVKPTVMKYSGIWVSAGNDVSASNARLTSLAFAPDGTLYVAYADDGVSGKLSVKKLNDVTWETVGTAGFSVDGVDYVSLAISPDGTPYVAYADYGVGGGKAIVSRYTEGAWIGSEVSSGQSTFTSLAISPEGKPCVAYVDIAGTGKANALQYNGTAWVHIGSADFSAGTATFTLLAISPDGIPFVGYSDDANEAKATVRYIDNPAPDTFIDTNPANPTILDSAAFTFHSNDSAATFECQLDGSIFAPCVSSIDYSSLALGEHTFSVRAVNVKGIPDPTQADYTWTINSATATVVKISANNYSTFAAALDAAAGEDTLQILASIGSEGVSYSGNGMITLEGGYNDDWSRSATLFSTVSSLTITGGTLIIDRIVMQ